jgi:hypothetical protein
MVRFDFHPNDNFGRLSAPVISPSIFQKIIFLDQNASAVVGLGKRSRFKRKHSAVLQVTMATAGRQMAPIMTAITAISN